LASQDLKSEMLMTSTMEISWYPSRVYILRLHDAGEPMHRQPNLSDSINSCAAAEQHWNLLQTLCN
jgi:hypothetical protein